MRLVGLLEQLNRVTVLTVAHQRCEHFDLQRRYFGEEANAVGHAALVGLQHVKHVPNEVERAGFDAVAAKDDFLRVDPVGDGERRLLFAKRSAGEAQDVSVPVMEGNGEPAAIGAGACIPGFPKLQGLGGYAQRGQRRMRRVETSRIRLWVKRRLLSCFLRLGSCGPVLANCTSTVLYSSEGAVKLVGRVLHSGATYMRGEGDCVTAGLFCKAVEQSFGRSDDQRAVAAGLADGAGAPELAAVKHEIEAKHLHGLFDRDTGFQLREIHEGHVSILYVSGESVRGQLYHLLYLGQMQVVCGKPECVLRPDRG